MSNPDHLPKAYDPQPVEDKWAKYWVEEGIYTADVNSKRPKFSMVLPPPNVTGSLHMGHALCFTLPDIIARWKRMQGFNVMWLPGTDHASIAVHNVIEQSLAEKGISREKLGREEFLRIAWQWKEKYGGIITHQLKRLGASLDWTRERFTMDPGFSYAVRKVFVDLYQEGLIYRDYYLVNRCPRCQTVLSDIEIEHREVAGKLYYIRYPLADGEGEIIVATTRPETMLGDTAVAVHPEDPRYFHLHGRLAILPLVGRRLPIITEERVEKEFGTGAVKVTPAHDPVDFEIGRRHGLDQVQVIDGSGHMTEAAGLEFKGLDRFACRQKVIEKLKEQGFLIKIEDYRHNVGHCYRCQTIIEPYLSWQWFVRMKPLAGPAIKAVEEGQIIFIPSNWAKTYFDWMDRIHDWCISRQLWWGHRIPAWYCQDCGEIIVSLKEPERCYRCESHSLKQDEDILDTWFSSALWPFVTLGWPEETPDLRVFYPTDLMATGFDIIFFWVARMIMMGLKFVGQIPFHHVFINGLVRDMYRRKMSKSQGNIVDPLEMIQKYGTDALRFTLASLAVPGMDISLSEERMAGYRAFANKIWNASRFVLMNVEGHDLTFREEELTLADRWIRSRLKKIIVEINEALEQYKFYEAAEKVYHFVWHEFCDWYLELAKPSLREGRSTTRAVLLETLSSILRLLHPFMPFITEEIYHYLPAARKSISLEPFPKPDDLRRDEQAESLISLLQEVVTEIRTIRSEHRLPPSLKILAWIKPADESLRVKLAELKSSVEFLAGLSRLEMKESFEAGTAFLRGAGALWEIALPAQGIVDLKAEKERLKKEIKNTEEEIVKLRNRLLNPAFVEKAPAEVVEETRVNLGQLEARRHKLMRSLAGMD